jgi:hypothetical protein
VRIAIRHLSIKKNRAQKRNRWHAPSWLYVRPAKKRAMVNYVFIDRGLLMGAISNDLPILKVSFKDLYSRIWEKKCRFL